MSRKYRILCGVPKEDCTGTKLMSDQVFHTTKCHQSREEAFRCMVHYLKAQGFEQVGSHEFKEPESMGGYIRVLPRHRQFGALLVTGKELSRYMPEKRKQGNRGVLV